MQLTNFNATEKFLGRVPTNLDGRIHDSNFSYTAGGVARNICEALYKLGCAPNFISAVGDDEQGKLLKSLIPQESSNFVRVLPKSNTAQCIVVFNNKGDCPFLMGDMDIHRKISPEMIKENENIIKTSPLLILDGNLSIESLEAALELANKHKIPVLYEPTDLLISIKPFESSFASAVKFITPNLNELKHIANYLNISSGRVFRSNVEEAAFIAKRLVNHIDNVIVTLGSDGLVIARKAEALDPFFKFQPAINCQVSVRYYPVVKKIDDIVNVCGAGDCLAAGFISAALAGLSEVTCVSVGFAAAETALKSQSAVPYQMFDKAHSAWKSLATYETVKL